MKTILVPTDFSKNSINAIGYAVAVAKKEKAKIILINTFHLVSPASDIPLPADVIQSTRVEVNSKLHKLCLEITKLKKVKCEYLCKFNLAVDGILEAIKEQNPELVIMGTKGASGIKEILMGSNTASVIEKAKCPVIAVPAGVVFSGIKNILYASDYCENDIDSLKRLIEIAKLFKATITVLHASDEEFNRFSEEEYLKSFKNNIQKKIKYKKISYKLVYGKLLERVLQKEIGQSSYDLIAMSTGHRNFLEKLVGTSVTKKMAFHSEIPLMAFHHKKESAVFI